jgi:deoxycytidylate deaminase
MVEYNWKDVSEIQLKQLNELDAIFFPAPRAISDARLLQLVRQYLPKANIIFGVANEDYVLGFENQLQFTTLKLGLSHSIISKVNRSSPHKILLLKYSQSDISQIYSRLKVRRVILINGSWLYSYHLRPEYLVLKKHEIPFKFVSPFSSEDEAIAYANNFTPVILELGRKLSESQMMLAAKEAARNSFDTSFQTGVSIGKKDSDKYELLDTACNTTVPYLTYAWHFGASREKNKCQPGDMNHYDAVHAETMLVLQAQKRKYDTKDSTLFINLLPCPNCARMLCEFDFNELVYERDHSDGYAVELLSKAGKKVRRLSEQQKEE